jgi:hypothetical protein
MDPLPNRTWWGRNWKWVVPLGCLTPILVCGGLITLIFVLVFGAITSSDVYTDALATAKNNDEVKAFLGEPIEVGWVSGSVNINGASGTADLAIPISGPKGSATLYAVAKKTAGKWEYSTLEVAPQGPGARIDLGSARAR